MRVARSGAVPLGPRVPPGNRDSWREIGESRAVRAYDATAPCQQADASACTHGPGKPRGHARVTISEAIRMRSGAPMTLPKPLRTLARRPGFTALVVLTLALGVGADAAIFAVARGMLLAPFPYRDADRVVTLWSRWTGYTKTWVSVDEARIYSQEVPSLEGLALYTSLGVNLTGGGEPERVRATAASAGVFSVLGVEPLLGRTYTAEEDVTDARVLVVGHELWQRRLGGAPSVVGSTLEIDGIAHEVIGVMPPGIRLPEDYRADERTELWAPLAEDLSAPSDEAPAGGGHGYFAVGRLADGATVEGLRAELQAITDRRNAAGIYPAEWAFTTLAFPVATDVLGEVEPAIGVLAGAVAFVLLLAAANVVHLLVVRQRERGGELAVRAALGAGRARLLRLLVGETAVLALIGGLAGAGFARLALVALRALAPPGLPRLDAVRLDGTVVVFAIALALVTGLAVGLVAAFRTVGRDLGETLRTGGRGGSAAGTRRSRGMLVAVEMATAVVLLVGAALMVRTVQNLLSIDPGFQPEGALTFRVQLPLGHYPETPEVTAFVERAVARFGTLPGVIVAGATRSLPLATELGDRGVQVEGYERRPDENVAADWQVVSPGAFEAMGMRLLAGRSIEDGDRADAQAVVVVNEAFARRFWPDGDAVGRRLKLNGEGAPWATVVGVVADLRHNDLLSPVKPGFYWPHAQFALSTGFAPRGMTFVLRGEGDPMALWPSARAALQELDPRLPVAAVRTLDDAAATATAPSRFAAGVLLALAVLALVLAAVGVYGVLSRSVVLRTREIGVRVALGARPSAIVGAVTREGMSAALAGVTAGLVLAAWLARFLAGMVHGVTVRDPATFVVVPLALAAVALVASAIPAWRASRVDPVEALKAE